MNIDTHTSPDEAAQTLLMLWGVELAHAVAEFTRDDVTTIRNGRQSFWSDVETLLRLESQSDEPSH